MRAGHAFVTGASQGLGRYLAEALADAGWQVVGIGLRLEPKAAGAHTGPGDAHSDRSGTFRYVQADLSDSETLPRVTSSLQQRPDLVVHCAVSYPERTEGAADLLDLERTFRVNALAPYLLTLDLLDGTPGDHFTCVVVINSEAIFSADRNSAPYAASKAALRVLTAGLADGCRSRNGAVATLLLGPLGDPRKESELQAIADKRGVSAEEVTRVFLRQSNPNLVIDSLIDYASCLASVEYIASLGPVANGMVCRLDGQSAGSLI
ncbi:SDR family oxidoreductase [Streptomyces olivaceus]|uniref:SDR family oxidoreductase n=1 Tax=Streptomyces olivaceus TaxID=47716 RepID=UPI001884C1D1|nr:SDR family oxidoreductase [Streptomyces olivaceus]